MDRITATLADFAADLRYEHLTPAALHATKRLLIDAFGCALGGYDGEPAVIARRLAAARSATPAARVLGSAIRTTAEAAAFANTVMIRYLDANDQYQGPAGSGHPSDTLGAILAAAEITDASARDLQVAIVAAYEVFDALADQVPVRDLGWDQGVFVAPASAVGAGILLGLSRDQIGEAIAIAGTAYVPTRQTRAGALAMWKGCATAAAAQGGLWAALLANEGMTGPTAAYEGPDGLWQQVTGPFTLGPLGRAAGAYGVERSNYKRFPAEFHSQGPLAAVLGFRERVPVDQIAALHVQIYAMAYGEIGSGAAKWDPHTRETADHSLPYLLAVALTDGEISPASFSAGRVADPALRPLMAKITVAEQPAFTARYPEELLSEVELLTASGERMVERTTYPKGHARNPLTDADIEAKFRDLARPLLGDAACDRALRALWGLDGSEHISALLDLCAPTG